MHILLYMRSVILPFLFALCISCAGTKNRSAVTTNKLNGTWVPVMQEIGGTLLPATLFEKQQLILQDTSYTVMAESVDKGTVKYKDGKMDIYGKEGVNKGKHFTAIYKIENEQLSICYNLKGDAYPESFQTSGKAYYFLSLFKKK
jgi:uncharacterized protein (TIGR03067 family)